MTGRVVRFVMASFDDYMASIRNVRLDAFLLSRESRP